MRRKYHITAVIGGSTAAQINIPNNVKVNVLVLIGNSATYTASFTNSSGGVFGTETVYDKKANATTYITNINTFVDLYINNTSVNNLTYHILGEELIS
jgi:hypothetical protein